MEKETWANAKKHCETKFGGSYTLLVNNRHIHNALVQFMELADIIRKGHVWMGITQIIQDKWLWIDGTPYSGRLSVYHR